MSCEDDVRLLREDRNVPPEHRLVRRNAVRPEEIFQALDRCSIFLSIGTSGQVYPAAGFAEHVRMRGGVRSVELNLEKSVISRAFTETIFGPASEIVPTFVEKLL